MTQGSAGWRRPLVIGASGQVGVELCRALEMSGAGPVLRAGRSAEGDGLALDLAKLATPEAAETILGPVRPDLILCAGAMTFVDGCEDQPELAARINTYAPSILAAYAHAHGVPFVYFSSDYVFDGTPEHPGPYAEDATPQPLNVYGRTKLEGERAVLRVHPGALVVRTSWVYGPDAAGKNFLSGLLRQLRAGQQVRVPSDQVSTPTLNRDLARVTLAFVSAGETGIVHVTGPTVVSRLELARTIAAYFDLPSDLVDGVETHALGQRARRPLLSGLVSNRLPALGEHGRLRSLEEGLKESAADLTV